MLGENALSAWDSVVTLPETRRNPKPRTTGITMVIDKGLGLGETRDLLEMAAEHIDLLKIAFGSSALYPSTLMRKKIDLIKSYGVEVYPGGTLFEIAVHQGTTELFFRRAKELGFTFIEVSDGTIELPPDKRRHYIRRGIEEGFGVVSEIGKKDNVKKIDPSWAIDQIRADLAAGSFKVIIEGRDSGRGVGIYDEKGEVKADLLDSIIAGVRNHEQLIIEAPQTSQHNFLLVELGPNVNIGNVQPHDVLTLESTRVGLRGDTLRHCLKNAPKSY